MFDAGKFFEGLKTKGLGRRLETRASVGSTNDEAKALAAAGAPHGTLVVAETQTSGRGRFGRSWWSPPGGLWFSLLILPRERELRAAELTVIAGLSAARAIETVVGVRPLLGWPNDLVFEGRKLGGILVEASHGMKTFAVVGAGINVNNDAGAPPGGIAPNSISLRLITGSEQPLERLLAAVMNGFEALLDAAGAGGFDSAWEEWKRRLGMVGEVVALTVDGKTRSGTVKDFTRDGGMVLTSPDGEDFEVALDRGTLASSKYAKHL
ncbi:MAG: biotin--[acetyl-CoA-carboxylase] ligase [bacterium]